MRRDVRVNILGADLRLHVLSCLSALLVTKDRRTAPRSTGHPWGHPSCARWDIGDRRPDSAVPGAWAGQAGPCTATSDCRQLPGVSAPRDTPGFPRHATHRVSAPRDMLAHGTEHTTPSAQLDCSAPGRRLCVHDHSDAGHRGHRRLPVPRGHLGMSALLPSTCLTAMPPGRGPRDRRTAARTSTILSCTCRPPSLAAGPPSVTLDTKMPAPDGPSCGEKTHA